MGEGRQSSEGRYADAPVVGLTGARFGGAAGRRLREDAEAAVSDECRQFTTHRRLRRRPVVGQTGARFAGFVSQPTVADVDTASPPSLPAGPDPQVRLPPEPPPPARPGSPTDSHVDSPVGSAARAGDRDDNRGSGRGADPEWSASAVAFRRVRPYTWTNGRTASSNELAVEALISATGREADATATPEHHAVLGLCATPRSVAELAALLPVPLGVARVLLGDMAAAGIVRVHRTGGREGEPDLALLRRVRDALLQL